MNRLDLTSSKIFHILEKQIQSKLGNVRHRITKLHMIAFQIELSIIKKINVLFPPKINRFNQYLKILSFLVNANNNFHTF